MLSRTTTMRAVIAAVLAAAVGASGATTASAATVTRSDDTAADFTLGTQSDTIVRADEPAGVEIAPTLDQPFDGTTLPTGWTATTWPGGAAPVPGAGVLVVDAARVNSDATFGPGSSVEFTADLGAEPYRHVGFAPDFDTQPWAIFSTGNGSDLPTGLWARMSDGVGGQDEVNVALTPVSGTHRFRIDWTATGFAFYLDGSDVPVASQDFVLTAAMPVGASDYQSGADGVTVDGVTVRTRTSGVFTSRVIDAGDARVTDATLTSVPPNDPGIAFDTRTAASEADLTAAPWTALGAGGAVAGAKPFVQYRATLTTTTPAVTPRLDKVDVAFTVDDEAPVVAIHGVDVTGASATATFGVTGATGDIMCSLDGGTAAACTSPKTYAGLADGAHTLKVVAKDAVANEGSDTKTFTVDTTAPRVTIGAVAVSGTSASVPFSTDDAGASIACKLDAGAFTACASPAQFSGLAGGAHTVVVRATDARGNAGQATATFVVAAPALSGDTDTKKPKVRVLGRRLKVSHRGVAKLRVRCPRSESECKVTVKLKQRGKRVARKKLTLSGGETRTFRLRLSAKARAKLAARGRMRAKAVVRAVDEAGNAKKTERRVTLLAPVG